MRKIKIAKNQSFQIHIEEKIERDNFFFHEYEMAVEHLNQIWNDQEVYSKMQYNLLIENPNNIIAFCGERGSGKSSIMLSFVNTLCQLGNGKDEFEFSNAVRNNNWDAKVVIDPSMFDGVHNIVDIVLAHIFQSFNDAYQIDNQKFDQYEREKILSLMAKAYKNLSIIKNKEKMLNDEYDEAGNIAKLQKVGESTRLKNTLNNLISVYLEMISKVKCKQGKRCEKLLIAIDDLDLCNEYAYEMAEQIRKYLILPNVIIFMALKIEQLELGIEEKNRKDYKNVIASRANSWTIEAEISNMSQRYLTKLIPGARRIFLPDLNNAEFNFEIDYENNRNDNSDINGKRLNAEEILLNSIRKKTGMIFGKEMNNNYHYFISENLREFVNFVIFLWNLSETNGDEHLYLQNLYDFKIYFINEILKSNIKEEQFLALKEVLDCDDNSKNYNVKTYLNNLLLRHFNNNNNVLSGGEYEYPMISFASVVDGLNNVASYLTKKSDYCLLYYLKVYYTIILHQSFLENNRIFPYALTNGFIWGNRINTVMPASLIEQQGYVSRGRFILNITKCWDVICKNISSEDVFSFSGNNLLYVKGIEESRKWELSSVWILMAALVSNVSFKADGKICVHDGDLIYDNHLVASVMVSPSIENYFGALCSMEMTIKRASLQLLGVNQKDVDKILSEILKKNEEQINAAQIIVLNPVLSMRLLEYCQQKGDVKDSKGKTRTHQLCKKFFKNVQSFLYEEKLGDVDMSKLWVPTANTANELTGEYIDICEVYASMYESQKVNWDPEIDNNEQKIDNTIKESKDIFKIQKLKRDFAIKVNMISTIEFTGKIKSIPVTLRNKKAEWVKAKLEDIANYIWDYTYKNHEYPRHFNSDSLIELYSDVVDLYAMDPFTEISGEQYETYKMIAQAVNNSNSRQGV